MGGQSFVTKPKKVVNLKMKKAKPTAMKVAKRALNIAKQNVEESKYFDVPFDQFANYTPTTAANGGLLSLSDIPKNAGAPSASTRESDEVRLMSLQIRAQIEFDPANYPFNMIRLIVIRDINNTISSVGDLLEVPTSLYTINSPYKYSNTVLKRNFQVLYDKTFDSPVKNGNSVPTVSQIVRHAIHIKRQLNLKASWVPGTAFVLKNEIKMFVIGDVPFASKGAGFSCFGYSRIYFKEN